MTGFGRIARQRSTLAFLAVVVAGAIGGVALMANGEAATAPQRPHTQTIVLRPVTADGRVARAWRVVADGRPAIECSRPSPVALDDGIAACGSSADATLACWASATPAHVLCLTDPFSRQLRSIRLAGPFPSVTSPDGAGPLGLGLDNGNRYLARSGGAWGVVREHPDWVGWFYERGTRAAHLIYGPTGGIGIDRTRPQWRVSVFTQDGRSPGVRRDVVRAYYVGTGAGTGAGTS